MMAAKEVFISSSSAPMLHCVKIDGTPVGGKAPDTVKMLADYLREEFLRETEG